MCISNRLLPLYSSSATFYVLYCRTIDTLQKQTGTFVASVEPVPRRWNVHDSRFPSHIKLYCQSIISYQGFVAGTQRADRIDGVEQTSHLMRLVCDGINQLIWRRRWNVNAGPDEGHQQKLYAAQTVKLQRNKIAGQPDQLTIKLRHDSEMSWVRKAARWNCGMR